LLQSKPNIIPYLQSHITSNTLQTSYIILFLSIVVAGGWWWPR